MRIIALAALTLMLTGCVPADPVVTPVPVPSTTPLFATDADALKAAEDAYAAYLKVSDQILRDGGADPERIDAVATGEARTIERSGYVKLRASGEHSQGASTYDSASLEFYDKSASQGDEVVRIYVCQDISKTDIVDSQGLSVIKAGRVVRIPLEVGFETSFSNRLIVSSDEVWAGKGVCE
jgi:hypothetical protein